MADRKPLVLIDGIPQGLPSGDTILVEKIRASSGILFGENTADANKLSHYETGTWTPVITGSAGGSLTYTTQNGNFTRIGRIVIASCDISWSAIASTITGLLKITGFPYANGSVRSVGNFGVQSTGIYCNSPYKLLKFLMDPNNDYAYVLEVDETITSGANYSHNPVVASSGNLYGATIIYQC